MAKMEVSHIKRVTSNGRLYLYYRPTMQRLPDDEEAAVAEARRLASLYDEQGQRQSIRDQRRATARQAWQEKMVQLCRSAKCRAAKKGREFSISPGLLVELLERQDYRCAITGIAFSERSKAAGYWRRPFAPSLDRRDACGGYSPNNVRLVVAAANVAMGEWGEDVFLRVASAAVAYRARPTAR